MIFRTQERIYGLSMNMVNDIFAKNLKARRRELGLTQKELAELIGYTEKSVSKWESGFAIAPSAILPQLAKHLQTSIDTLFRDELGIKYFLGIDGGGTKTEFALADTLGNIIRRTTLGGSNPIDIGIENTLSLLADGISIVTDGVPVSRISVFAGISGGITGSSKPKIKEFLEGMGFAAADCGSDAENATALALGDGDGTAIIIGTGSIAFTREGGVLRRYGGYGFLFDDGGSGFAIGRDAIIASLTAEEGRSESTILLPLLSEALMCDRLIDSLGKLYAGGKRTVASIAPLVFDAYFKGDKLAEEILNKNMSAVARLIEASPYKGTEPRRTVLVGGLTKDFSVLEPLIKKHLKNPEKYDISANSQAPVYGALSLAGAKNLRYEEQ